jgi:hypothetical protein
MRTARATSAKHISILLYRILIIKRANLYCHTHTQLAEDRQREIGLENTQLMVRLARAMQDTPAAERTPATYPHLSQKSRDVTRLKRARALTAENARFARSLSEQKPFYSTQSMRDEEKDRQCVLKTMSRAQRRKDSLQAVDALFRAESKSTGSIGMSTSNGSSSSRHGTAQLAIEDLTAELQGGVLFKAGLPVDAEFKLRTARQMKQEVARAQGYSSAPSTTNALGKHRLRLSLATQQVV